MYEEATTSVRMQDRATEAFPITIGLHQGSTLSLNLITLVLDVLTKTFKSKHIDSKGKADLV